jgi:glutamate racemase
MYNWGISEDARTRSAFPTGDAGRGIDPFNAEYTQGDTSNRPESDVEDTHSPLQASPSAPIGVFDSGVGGLTILSALRQELPQEHYIYLGDTANCPYGVRSEAEITELTVRACRFFIEQGVKLIVIACNTASQAALNTLRATFSLPFVGVVPAVKPAARLTKHGRIGVAATNQW